MNNNNISLQQGSKTYTYLAVPQNKKIFYYATSAGRQIWAKDYKMEREDINIYMINYIVRGRARIKIKGRDFPLEKGDLTFLHLTDKSVLTTDSEETEIIFFHVLGGQVADIYNAYLESGDYISRGMSEEFISSKFEEFAAILDGGGDFYAQSGIIFTVLTEILRLRSMETNHKYPEFIDRILCYILYTCPLPTPKEVAKHFGFSHIYLERLFKKYVGESMRNYILKQKYSFACSYLVDTDMSVEEVARKVGYSDSKGLIVLFSKFSDLTPLNYRKKAREIKKEHIF